MANESTSQQQDNSFLLNLLAMCTNTNTPPTVSKRQRKKLLYLGRSKLTSLFRLHRTLLFQHHRDRGSLIWILKARFQYQCQVRALFLHPSQQQSLSLYRPTKPCQRLLHHLCHHHPALFILQHRPMWNRITNNHNQGWKTSQNGKRNAKETFKTDIT